MSHQTTIEAILDLIIDIGNTRAKLLAMSQGIPVDEQISDSEELVGLDDFVHRHNFEKGIVSTVSNVGEKALAALESLPFSILWLDSKTALPIPTSFPESMGADRIAAIVGAMTLRPGTPLLIVDAGTCVTYEFIDDRGTYLGGNIAPGLRIRMLAMHEHTALLPLVEVNGDVPEIGYDTETAMRAGAVLGLKHEIEGYIRNYRNKHPKLEVFLTGGDEFKFNEDIEPIIHSDHYLVPRGLWSILNHNIIKEKPRTCRNNSSPITT